MQFQPRKRHSVLPSTPGPPDPPCAGPSHNLNNNNLPPSSPPAFREHYINVTENERKKIETHAKLELRRIMFSETAVGEGREERSKLVRRAIQEGR
jgi:hypothetical protein